jgi:hypothetical protein
VPVVSCTMETRPVKCTARIVPCRRAGLCQNRPPGVRTPVGRALHHLNRVEATPLAGRARRHLKRVDAPMPPSCTERHRCISCADAATEVKLSCDVVMEIPLATDASAINQLIGLSKHLHASPRTFFLGEQASATNPPARGCYGSDG